MPESEAKKMEGTTWTVELKKKDGGVWSWWTTCKEMPEQNQLMEAKDGEEKEREWPQLGEGKFKVRTIVLAPFTCV